MQDIQRRRMINALSLPVTPAERRVTVVSDGCRFGHLCVLAAIAAGLAVGLGGPAVADTTSSTWRSGTMR